MSTAEIAKAAQALKEADAILVTAANGFSISEGLSLFARDARFMDIFKDFNGKFGITSIIEGCYYAFPSASDKWAWWSRLINHYVNGYKGSRVMDLLKKVLGNKPVFILTTNGEGHFQMAGFKDEDVFEVEGSWRFLKSASGGETNLIPDLELMKELDSFHGQIPDEKIPRSSQGQPLVVHIENPNGPYTYGKHQSFNNFLETWKDKKLVVLELGVGSRNQFIKQPAMQIAAQFPNAKYITINKGDLFVHPQIAAKSTAIDGLLDESLEQIWNAMNSQS